MSATRKNLSEVFLTDHFTASVRLKRGSTPYRTVAKQVGGITAMAIHHIEHQRHTPNLETYIRICRWLGVSLDTFVGKPADKPKLSQNH